MRLIFFVGVLFSQSLPPVVKIGKLKYGGGGDWYANPSSLKNLFTYIRENTSTPIQVEEQILSPASKEIFTYDMLYITGHGNITFTPQEAANLHKYLTSGGFLLMDDNYGMHPYALKAIAQIFPDIPLQEIPTSHPIYHVYYDFPYGLPKIHEHDNKPPQLLGIFYRGRLVLLLTYEADLGDGWEDPEVHNDPPAVRELAFKMGTNILFYILTHPY